MAERKKVFAQLKHHIEVHLRVESEFLFLEAEDCQLNIPVSFFNISRENHAQISKDLKKIEKIAAKRIVTHKDSAAIEALGQTLENHFSLEESALMPKMRKQLPTQEREDLGLVYSDLVAEPVPVTPQNKRKKTRKRA